MMTEHTSQLRAADAWGRRTGDYICGPLAFFALLHQKKKNLKDLKAFLRLYFGDFVKTRSGVPRPYGLSLEEGLARLAEPYKSVLKGYKPCNLDRRRGQRDLLQSVCKTLEKAAAINKPVILQIGAYCGTVVNEQNLWTRTLGHFVVCNGLQPRQNKVDPFRVIELWDPWDGRAHSSVLFEEVFRDFTALKPPHFDKNFRLGRRLSPNGHRVLSPYLNLLAPHMDLYSSEVYFSQRYLYAIERALIPAEAR
jgi:hypothetical protein